jgi:hypothetical protein
MSVLQVGKIEWSLAAALKAKYQVLSHVDGATARGASAVTELALRNFNQFLTHRTLTTPWCKRSDTAAARFTGKPMSNRPDRREVNDAVG